MKKILFASFIIVFCLFVFKTTPLRAEEPTVNTNQVQLEESVLPSDTVVERPQYVLPFPGMLPDHPLYSLKRVRDYILERLITDPIKKTEFFILQADKRLQMGATLLAEKKNVLGESTISKGEKYLYNGVQVLKKQKEIKQVVPPYIIEKITASGTKHIEMITALATEATDPEIKAGLLGSVTFTESALNDLGGIK